MSKTTTAAPAPQETAAAAPAEALRITLHEFCLRLSVTVRRPELIGAFSFTEQRAGNAQDTEAAYKARFDAFVNKPI